MKSSINNLAKKLLTYSLSPNTAKKLIDLISREFQIDLLQLAYHSMGILKYENPEVSGETFLINNILLPYFKKNSISQPVIFDIGANKGTYSVELGNQIPFAELFAFEPNPNTYKVLENRIVSKKNIKSYEIGFGSASMTSFIYTYKNELDSEHASVLKEVLQDLHKAADIEELPIRIEVLDNFCDTNHIKNIHFLKIDTEGFELEVLKGSQRLLAEKRIDIIQFEFNEMNVSSRVFLKDFYKILEGFSLYRLDSYQLIPLNDYLPMNEIFVFQNIIAIRSDLAHSNYL